MNSCYLRLMVCYRGANEAELLCHLLLALMFFFGKYIFPQPKPSKATLPLLHLPEYRNHGRPRSYLEHTAAQVGQLANPQLHISKKASFLVQDPSHNDSAPRLTCVCLFSRARGDKSLGRKKSQAHTFPGSAFCGEERGSAHVRNVISEMFFVAVGNGIVAIATRTRGRLNEYRC